MNGNPAFYNETPNGIVLSVRAAPRSSRAGIGGIHDGALKVHLHSAPVDGKANTELISVLADAFDVPKRNVEILGGSTSKTKRVLIHGVSVDAYEKLVTL